MFDEGKYSPHVAEPFSCRNTISTTRKKKIKNKRRFSDEQIKSLETMFESESRLEPRKKLELAKKLGLQPRQVAIWFQNKRARWKSKQLERDYSILNANYNSLASRFEALKKEKQALIIQLQELNGLTKKTREEGKSWVQDAGMNSSEGESDNGDSNKCETEIKPSLSSFDRSEHGLGILSDEDSSIKAEYFGIEEEPNLMNMVKPAESLTSKEDWKGLDSDELFNQSDSGCRWWEFWA
ncbi:hypothetical protein K2173_025353 [Erythroxylum novogranatense]|uniref:Homeobox-leucine zipper protein n=1 Tax=Erythroxylum novogranatense TaxID=1862640 RepID=A0AAV8UDT0_9ROSI|nr:hypothetical protein K2173_025353 [Erythroxylum novogranatense]